MKKKILAAVILFVLFLSIIPGASAWSRAQEILTDYTDEQLKVIISMYKAELLRRSGDPFVVHAGVYVVGFDLPSGAWRVELVNQSAELCAYANEYTFQQELAFPFFDQLLNEYAGVTTIGRIFLTDGNIVEIKGDLLFSPYTGIDQE